MMKLYKFVPWTLSCTLAVNTSLTQSFLWMCPLGSEWNIYACCWLSVLFKQSLYCKKYKTAESKSLSYLFTESSLWLLLSTSCYTTSHVGGDELSFLDLTLGNKKHEILENNMVTHMIENIYFKLYPFFSPSQVKFWSIALLCYCIDVIGP